MTSMLTQIGQKLARPYLRAWDVRGRSTAGELWGFLLTSGALSLIGSLLIAQFSDDFRVQQSIAFWGKWALTIPLVALLCRRLHDFDYSAWWVLVTVPILISNFAKDHCFAFAPPDNIGTGACHQSFWIALAGLPGVLLFMTLLVAAGKAGPNRFGPDQRTWPVSPAPQA